MGKDNIEGFVSKVEYAGELSAADLPPEGNGGQGGGFDMSIDVFPRLHERDPYGWLLPLLLFQLQGPLLMSSNDITLILIGLDSGLSVLQAAGRGERQLL